MSIKDGCRTIQSPFSDNYCRDWLIYHGGIALLGAVISIYGFLGIGSTVSGIALVAGVINYWMDKDFKKFQR